MSSDQDKKIEEILELFKTVNSKVFTLTRCALLALLSLFKGGLQYRELRAALDISDGKLISNLNALKEMGYVKKNEFPLDQKKVDIYEIEEKGKEELGKIISWVKMLEKLKEEKDDG
ncbi:MAG: transcriptional regulator [Candidatus Hodarchaeota archaeon]